MSGHGRSMASAWAGRSTSDQFEPSQTISGTLRPFMILLDHFHMTLLKTAKNNHQMPFPALLDYLGSTQTISGDSGHFPHINTKINGILEKNRYKKIQIEKMCFAIMR
jgi:hypothetical protein